MRGFGLHPYFTAWGTEKRWGKNQGKTLKNDNGNNFSGRVYN